MREYAALSVAERPGEAVGHLRDKAGAGDAGEDRRLVEVRQRPGQRAEHSKRIAREAHQPAGQHLQIGRLPIGPIRSRAGQLPALGREVEEHSHDLGAGEAVDQRVVDLREQRLLPVLQPVDQIELPERARPIERAGDDAGDLLGELLLPTARRQSQLAHVEVEIEVGIVEPVGVIEPEGNLDEPPAQRRQQGQALLHQGGDVLEGELPARLGGRVQDRQPRHVTGLVRALQGEELRVEAGQLTHRAPSLRFGAFGRRRPGGHCRDFPTREPATPILGALLARVFSPIRRRR